MEMAAARSARRPVTDNGTSEESGDRTDRRRLGDHGLLLSSVLLASALVVALVVGVLLSVQYAQRDGSVVPLAAGGAGEQDRQQVQDAVGLFAANLNSYSVRDIGDYRSRIAPLLTDGFRASFDLAVDNTIAMVKSTRMTSRGEVLSTAVTTLDARTATALVVADAEVTSDIGDRQRHFRWKVSLVKQGDIWLVDNFTPVA